MDCLCSNCSIKGCIGSKGCHSLCQNNKYIPTEIICAVSNDHVFTLKINTVNHISFFRTVEKYLQVTVEFRPVSRVAKLFS